MKERTVLAGRDTPGGGTLVPGRKEGETDPARDRLASKVDGN